MYTNISIYEYYIYKHLQPHDTAVHEFARVCHTFRQAHPYIPCRNCKKKLLPLSSAFTCVWGVRKCSVCDVSESVLFSPRALRLHVCVVSESVTSFSYVTWLILICDMTHSHMCRVSESVVCSNVSCRMCIFSHPTHLILKCDMISYV